MISKIKKPVSILLALMMVVSLFTIVPMTASAETNDTITVFFSDISNWGKVYVYGWDSDGDTTSAFPGKEMNNLFTNGYGENVYGATIPASTTGIAFSNGSNSCQTPNITLVVDGGWWYGSNGYVDYAQDTMVPAKAATTTETGNIKYYDLAGNLYNESLSSVSMDQIEIPMLTAVAENTTTGAKYETLEAAVAAAVDGNTIKLLANCAGNGIKAPQGKFATNGLTVDFAGHTYTVDGATVGSSGTETQAFQLLKNNKITFKGGTITSTTALMLVQNYSDLTLKDMTLDGSNLVGNNRYTLSNNNGNVVIDGSTITAKAGEGNYAFDVCRYSSYPSVNVTVTGNSQINGDVEISASGSDAKEGFSLKLEGGDMSGDIVVDASAKALVGENNKVTKADDFTQEAPADFKWVADGEGTSKLVAKEYVAQVGTAKYETLDAAIAAAQAGDTVKLLADITLPAQSISGESSTYGAYITKSLTIDGDGHTVTSDAPRAFGVKGTQGDIDVTFKNITVTDKQQGAICVCTRGGINSLTLDNATLSTQGATKGYIQPLTIGGSQATKAKVDVINSTIQTGDAAGKHYAIILWNPVDLTIQNSTIKGWACVYQKAFEDASAGVKTEVTIDNSTLISKGIKGSSNNFATIFTENADFTCKITNTTMDITAAADTYQAVAASNSSASGFKVELGEGNNVTLTGDTALIGYNFNDETHEIAVSGGTFNTPVAEYYCADGYIPATLDEETGKYSVKTGAYVAQVNGVKYETLEAAFVAAQDGDTITVLADCAGNGIKVPQGKFATGLTVDFDGHTYTVNGTTVGSTGTETQGFQLLKGNKITFENGKITGSTVNTSSLLFLIQNYSDLTLDNMELSLAGKYYNQYTLSNNNGNIVINDSKINAPTYGGVVRHDVNSYAFDVCRFSSYPSVNVTVTGNSTINGDVEISASGSDAKEGFSLNLNGGTMTGAIVLDDSAKAAMDATPEKASVNKANTFNQDAPEGYKWVASGEGKQTLAKIVKLFTAHSITLDGNIELNFYINPEYADFENADSAKVKFSWDGENTAEVDLKKLVPGDDGYKASVELVAAQMANAVHAEVYLNDEKIGEENYTVREYAEELYKYPEKYDSVKTNELKTLAKALLNYGATAQIVFADDLIDDPEELANATVGYNGYEDVTAAQIGEKIQGKASDLKEVAEQLDAEFYTSSLIYLSRNTLRLYFTPASKTVGALDGKGFSGNQSKYYYYVEKENIPAAELDQQQYFNVDGVKFNYSALDYAKAVIEKNMDTEYQNLAKALFLYNQAAKAYIIG